MIMDGQRMTTLIDLGAQVSGISFQFCEDLTLQIQPLGRLLKLEGTGGSAIPYLRYVEVNLQIPGIKNYKEANAMSPVAYYSGANCDLWRVTSGVLVGTHLSMQLEHSLCQNPCKNIVWPGHACQPSTTSSPSDSEVREVLWQHPKRVDLGGPGPPCPREIA